MTDTIFIPRKEFLKTIKSLKVAGKGRNPPDMIFYCQDETLHIRMGGSEVQVAGTGHFDGQGKVDGKALQVFLRALPDDDPLLITKHSERLTIGNLSLKIVWETSLTTEIRVPVNADDLDFLKLAQLYTDEEIASAGLQPKIEAATDKLNQKLAKAQKVLKPYGVEFNQLAALVDETILSNRRSGGLVKDFGDMEEYPNEMLGAASNLFTIHQIDINVFEISLNPVSGNEEILGLNYSLNIHELIDEVRKNNKNLDQFLTEFIAFHLDKYEPVEQCLFFFAPTRPTFTISACNMGTPMSFSWMENLDGFQFSEYKFIPKNSKPFIYWEGGAVCRVHEKSEYYIENCYQVYDFGDPFELITCFTDVETYKRILEGKDTDPYLSVVPRHDYQLLSYDNHEFGVGHMFYNSN